ncbi:MAG: hypothetical protein IKN55_05225, partial [Oscillospiraceae bacterium]|nr:hypothetical protein [Oscillospiraceae bacterium]
MKKAPVGLFSKRGRSARESVPYPAAEDAYSCRLKAAKTDYIDKLQSIDVINNWYKAHGIEKAKQPTRKETIPSGSAVFICRINAAGKTLYQAEKGTPSLAGRPLF